MSKRVIIFFMSFLMACTSPVTVKAIQSPAGCNSNRLNLSLSRDKLTVQQGDTLTYTLTVSNQDAGPNVACDIDTATVTLRLPAMDGTPTGALVTLATNANYPAGTPISVVGTVPYVVNVNPGVIDITAEASVQGVLHDAPTDHAANITKTIGTAIVTPSIPPDSDDDSTSELPGLPNTGVIR